MPVVKTQTEADGSVTECIADAGEVLNAAPWETRAWAAERCNGELKLRELGKRHAAMVAALQTVDAW